MFTSNTPSGPPLVAGSITAFAAGSLAYWGYWHRYEVHQYSWPTINAFLLTCLGMVITGVNVYSLAISESIGATTMIAGAFLLGGFGNCLVWRMFFNPLNKFPGPWSARISCFWFTFQLGKADGYYKLQALHKKYGKYVRIGSNDLSITDPEIMELAYGNKSRVTKADWYDNDAPLTSMHTTRDKGLHDRRRRVWAPAFSEKAIRDYETEVTRLNDQFIQKMEDFDGQPVNVSKWFNLYSFDAMGLIGFGKEYGLMEKGEKPHALEMLDEGMAPLAFRLPAWFFRVLVAIPGAGAGYQKFIKFCVDELTWTVNNVGEKKRDNNIVSWLLKAYKDIKRPENDTFLQADSRLIIVAGSDTTAATLISLFYNLAQNPNVVESLRKELDPLTEGSWHEIDIRNAEYLNGCINEALRLLPPVPSGLARLTPPEGLQVGKTYIPGKAVFFNPMYVMGRGMPYSLGGNALINVYRF